MLTICMRQWVKSTPNILFKGRYFYSHFRVKETEANLAKVLIQYVHRPLQRQEPHSSSLSSSDS